MNAPAPLKLPPQFAQAGQCTHCGYCLPQCPTYQATLDERESPRGRLSMILAINRGEITPADAEAYLNHCLLCRACHTACPVGVHPGKIFMRSRTLAPAPPPRTGRLLHAVTDSRRLTALAAGLLNLYRRSGLRALTHRLRLLAPFGALETLERMLPDHAPRTPKPLKGRPPTGPRVLLFTGCMGRLASPHLGPMAQRVLTQLGARTTLLTDYGCCGAPHRDHGFQARFKTLAREVLAAIDAQGEVDAVVCDSSACALALANYARSMGKDPRWGTLAKELSPKVWEFSAFVAERLPFEQARWGDPGLGSIAYHDHCQARHALGVSEAPRRLLAALGVEMRPIVKEGCCGAGGDFMLRHPDLSEAVRRARLEALRDSDADVVVSGNPGCLMNIGGGLKTRHEPVEARHIVEILHAAIESKNKDKR